MKIRFIILSVLFSCTIIFAQSWSILNYLSIQQSPLFNGAGEIGAAVPMQDPAGYYYNPAQLGYYSLNNNVSIFFMPGNNTVLNNQNLFKTTSDSYGITAGYNFINNGNCTPLSIGIGYLHTKISSELLGFHNSYDCLSVGIGYENYFLYNLGFSIKPFTSITSGLEASGTAFDFGALVIMPFDKLYLSNIKFRIGDEEIKPILSFSTGYSISNIGEEVHYELLSDATPLPRTERLGYSLNLGFNINIAGTELPVIDYSFTAEVENVLTDFYNFTYKNPLGDINIVNNLFLLKPNSNVIIHKGNILIFFQTLTIYFGGFSGGGYSNFTTKGWAISTEGLFHILENNSSNRTTNYLFKHVCIKYYSSKFSTYTEVDPNYYPNLNEIALCFKDIEL
jgi:hypothetical protein